MSIEKSLAAGCDVPVEGLPTGELALLAQDLARVRCWVDRQLQRVCAAAGDDGRDLLASCRVFTARETRAIERRGELVRQFPEAAVLAPAHLDALANASERLGVHALRLNERLPELVSRAGSCGPDRFAVHTRAVVTELAPRAEAATLADQRAQVALRRWSDTRSGMRHYHLTLDPETADRVDTQLDAEIKRRWAAARTDVPDTTATTFASIAADAMVNRLTSTARGGSAVPEVVVIVDLETLQTDEPAGGAEHRSGKGSLLPPETLRRYACDAGIIPVVLDNRGMPIDVGRSCRAPTPAQRAVLRTLYPTCAVPDCTVGFDWCQLHHLHHWARHGPTDLANLLPLCHHHHHQAHEGGWRLTLDGPTRTLTIRHADGHLHSISQPPGSLAAVERHRRRARRARSRTSTAPAA